MIECLKNIFKYIFCLHEWNLNCKSCDIKDKKAYDVWYIFRCLKCGKEKTIKTKGIDVFESEDLKVKEEHGDNGTLETL